MRHANLLGAVVHCAVDVRFLRFCVRRFPQIYHNWKNHREGKSIDGLSMQMFALAFLANVCYGTPRYVASEALS